MVEIDMTTISSKGQVVIPSRLRRGFGHGQRLIAIRQGGRLILRKAAGAEREFFEDLEAARRADEAWGEYAKGKFRSKPKGEFLAGLEKW